MTTDQQQSQVESGAAVANTTHVTTNGDAATAEAAEEKHTSVLRDTLELLAVTGLIYGCFIGYGLLQEKLYHDRYGPDNERFDHSLFLVFFQCFVNAAFASLGFIVFTQPKDTTPAKEYVGIALSYIGAMFSSNAALAFVSYPTQALGKSCKLVPVMLTRIFINRVRYDAKEYFNVFLTTVGITIFQIFQSANEKKGLQGDSAWGLALLFISLVLDGFTGPKQEHIIARHKPTITSMMFWMNVWSVVACGIALVVTGRFMAGIEFCVRYPEVINKMIVFSLLLAVGQVVILITVFRFDSLVLTTITTTRKFFTLLASVVLYGHDLNLVQWSGVAMVFLGLGLNTWAKYAKKRDAIARHHAHRAHRAHRAANGNGHSTTAKHEHSS